MSKSYLPWRLLAAALMTACAGSQAALEAPPPTSQDAATPTQVPQPQVLAPDTEFGSQVVELPDLILLTIHDPNGDDLAIWNRVTGVFTALAPSPFNESHATWSPDGQWVAFQTDRDGDWEIYVVRPTCANPAQACSDGMRNLTNDPGNDMYPNWSLGGQVVHMSTRSGNPDIWLTPFDDEQDSQKLTEDPGPDWHPNLSWAATALALRSDRNGDAEIWGIDLSNGEAVNLTNSPGVDRYPGYSPDGTRILFVSGRDGAEEIYVMDANGGNPINLTNHPADDQQGSWSPDGRFVMFISDREGQGDLYLMDPATGEVTLLLDATFPLDWPFWQPLGVDGE